MSRWGAIRLVASREIVERGRSRGYALSLAFTVILMLVGFIVPALLVGNATKTSLAVVGDSPAGLEEWLTLTADSYDLELALSAVPDRAAAEVALHDGSIDAALEVPADLSTAGELIVLESAPRPSRPS